MRKASTSCWPSAPDLASHSLSMVWPTFCRSALSCGEGGSTSRYDNMNVGLLLQYIEAFNGVCIVVTNMKEMIDQAFFRRFRFVLEFERPTGKQRRLLWQKVLPKECPLEKDVDFGVLADRYELSGGQIKSIVLRAATRAALREESKRILNQSDLETSCKEELEKDGSGKSHASNMYI